jgi:hypothetical protein
VTWTKLLESRDVTRHRTSKRELDDIRALVAMAIACAGYRVTAKTGHHKISFDSLKLAVAASADKYAGYFETCRRKRNVIDYTRAPVATDTETEEIVKKARVFYEFVEGWIRSKFPNLKR